MKARINDAKSRGIFYNGKFYDTNVDVDLDLSTALRLGKICPVDFSTETQPYDPDSFRTGREFLFVSDIDNVSGWGNVSLNLIKNSSSEYNVSQLGKILNLNNREVIEASTRAINPRGAAIIHEQPKHQWAKLPFQKKIAIVPFETTIIPASWISRINACDALLVPCKQNIDAFKESGVTVPIELIHWGVDPEKFYEVERTPYRPFTFGTMGSLSKRKGTDILVDAFLKAFPTEKDVQLICKTSTYGFFYATKDKRVKVDMTPVDHHDLVENFFKKVDCFVFPTRGEGFGLTPLEAMATGIPAIVTNWSGPCEYMNTEVGWPLDFVLAPAKEFTDTVYKEECGKWAEPSLDHLVELMKYAYNNRDEVKKKGKAAAKYVRENWLWEHKIKMFHDALEKHL
jgi:glycosyltransferase involved in cell wall biosynthesis